MRIVKSILPLIVYVFWTCLEWYRYSIETDCFNKGGRLALAILVTTPLALSLFSILWLGVSELLKFILFRARIKAQ